MHDKTMRIAVSIVNNLRIIKKRSSFDNFILVEYIHHKSEFCLNIMRALLSLTAAFAKI